MLGFFTDTDIIFLSKKALKKHVKSKKRETHFTQKVTGSHRCSLFIFFVVVCLLPFVKLLKATSPRPSNAILYPLI